MLFKNPVAIKIGRFIQAHVILVDVHLFLGVVPALFPHRSSADPYPVQSYDPTVVRNLSCQSPFQESP